jgi:hypothetical protein
MNLVYIAKKKKTNCSFTDWPKVNVKNF